MDTHMLCVFVDEEGKFGDLASVVIDESKHISDKRRLAITQKLNTGETVFINNISQANITIMHPQGEIDFAGVAALGTAWLMSELSGAPIKTMQGRAGDIVTWQENDITWVRTDLATMPAWHHKQLRTARDIENIKLEDTTDIEHTMFWAWLDKAKGIIRARTFASDWDIPEAQGNGSGSMMLASILNKDIQIKHGLGSIIHAKPAPNNCADIGGRVIEVRSS